jgi:hypothetical protein
VGHAVFTPFGEVMLYGKDKPFTRKPVLSSDLPWLGAVPAVCQPTKCAEQSLSTTHPWK